MKYIHCNKNNIKELDQTLDIIEMGKDQLDDTRRYSGFFGKYIFKIHRHYEVVPLFAFSLIPLCALHTILPNICLFLLILEVIISFYTGISLVGQCIEEACKSGYKPVIKKLEDVLNGLLYSDFYKCCELSADIQELSETYDKINLTIQPADDNNFEIRIDPQNAQNADGSLRFLTKVKTSEDEDEDEDEYKYLISKQTLSLLFPNKEMDTCDFSWLDNIMPDLQKQLAPVVECLEDKADVERISKNLESLPDSLFYGNLLPG